MLQLTGWHIRNFEMGNWWFQTREENKRKKKMTSKKEKRSSSHIRGTTQLELQIMDYDFTESQKGVNPSRN